jgi:hypothetical protein
MREVFTEPQSCTTAGVVDAVLVANANEGVVVAVVVATATGISGVEEAIGRGSGIWFVVVAVGEEVLRAGWAVNTYAA